MRGGGKGGLGDGRGGGLEERCPSRDNYQSHATSSPESVRGLPPNHLFEKHRLPDSTTLAAAWLKAGNARWLIAVCN